MNEIEVQKRIAEFFEENYRRLLAEGGAHVLTPRALEQARQQVELYWTKMREVAVSVTETEVRLQLPNQKTPKGRPFVIEGVVDLVREANRLAMYDIKTHFCGEVRGNIDSYAAQLNVYAYIWRELRGQELREMGIIAVQLPEALRDAIRHGDTGEIERHLASWDPLVPIEPETSKIEETFAEIARAVDEIQDGAFSPPSVAQLRARIGREEGQRGRAPLFATLHCRNCDGRFSCDSYREYLVGGGKTGRRSNVLQFLSEAGDDGELEEWLDGNIELDLERLGSD